MKKSKANNTYINSFATMADKYPKSIRFFHWLLSLVVFFNIIGGLSMKYLPNDIINKAIWYSTHKSVGIFAIILILMRVINRLIGKIPKFSDNIATLDATLAKINVFLLYCCMVIVPVSGFVMSDAGQYSVIVYGIKIPNLVPQNPELSHVAHEIHCYANYIFIGLIALHLLGTLKHIIMDKINILKRMV